MELVDLAISTLTILLAIYFGWNLRAEFPLNIQFAALVLFFGASIVLWRIYVDVQWYWDAIALIVPVGAFLLHGVRVTRQLIKAASDEKVLARNNLIKDRELKDAIDAFERDDFLKAVSFFEERANQGNVNAQYNLGVMHEIGIGGLRDDQVAEKWYRRAAHNGLPQAQYSLAVILASDYMNQTSDYGYEPDIGDTTLKEQENRFVEAYAWLLEAKRGKHGTASSALRRLRKNMTAKQIDAAKDMLNKLPKPTS